MAAIPSWAFEGGACVCVKVGAWSPMGDTVVPLKRGPILGELLTISHIVAAPEGYFLGFVGFAFLDIFHVSRFGPVDGDNTEAELFRRRQHGADVPLESEVA